MLKVFIFLVFHAKQFKSTPKSTAFPTEKDALVLPNLIRLYNLVCRYLDS